MRLTKLLTLSFIGVLLLSGCNKAPADPAPEAQQSSSEQSSSSQAMILNSTFAGLLQSGQSLECNFEYTDEEYATTGTVWVEQGGNRMASEFTYAIGDGDLKQMYTIIGADRHYVWGDELEQGISINKDAFDGEVFMQSESEFEDDMDGPGLDDDTQLEFACDTWAVAESKFTPPSSVEFTDMSAAMESMKNLVEGGTVDCSLCDAVPDASAKAECLSALGC